MPKNAPGDRATADDEAATDFEAQLRSRARHGYVRVAGAGAFLFVVGAVVWAYGRNLASAQSDAAIQFVLPMAMETTGGITTALGGILLAAALVMRVRRPA